MIKWGQVAGHVTDDPMNMHICLTVKDCDDPTVSVNWLLASLCSVVASCKFVLRKMDQHRGSEDLEAAKFTRIDLTK